MITIPILLFLIFITIIVSGSSILLFKIGNKTIKLILAFSGAYLLAITVLHLIPEIYSHGSHSHTHSSPLENRLGNEIGIFILAGFLLQILIEYFSEGIEHGHIHLHKHSESTFPLTVMLALSVHSFLEGMPLAGDLTETKKSFATGIILHNVPIAIALMSMLIQSGQKKGMAFLWLLVFALMTPLGAMTGNLLEETILMSENYSNYILAVVVGIFLHVSTTILFESSDEHRFHFIKLTVILAGMGVALIFI